MNGTNGTSIVTSQGVPSGNCNSGDTDVDLANGEVYTCNSDNLKQEGIGGSAAPPWTDTGSSIEGPPGAPGAGLTFTTASGTTGPSLTQAGTYSVDVEADVYNSTSSPMAGFCDVVAQGTVTQSSFDEAFALSANSATDFSFSGIVTIGDVSSAAPAALSVHCTDVNSNNVTLTGAQWWVSPVGTNS
jgi:hypothetical protein